MISLATSTSRSSCSASRAMLLYRRSATSAYIYQHQTHENERRLHGRFLSSQIYLVIFGITGGALRSASWLVVPRHRLNTFGRRAFAVAGPMSLNSLPNSLHESACDDNISDDCFKHSLKTFLFSGYWRTERSRSVYDSALYKFTFTYLLTYLYWL